MRRDRLKAWIKSECEGVQQRFIAKTKIPQSQLSDMLRGAKSFGEKAARKIEGLAGMPAGYLDGDTLDVQGITALYHGIALTRAGALLAAEWEKLDLTDRIEIEQEIQARVARKVRQSRPRRDDPDRPALK